MTVNDFVNKWCEQGNIYIVPECFLDECIESLENGNEITCNYSFCMFNPKYSQFQIHKYLKDEIAFAEVVTFYIYGKSLVLFIKYDI